MVPLTISYLNIPLICLLPRTLTSQSPFFLIIRVNLSTFATIYAEDVSESLARDAGSTVGGLTCPCFRRIHVWRSTSGLDSPATACEASEQHVGHLGRLLFLFLVILQQFYPLSPLLLVLTTVGWSRREEDNQYPSGGQSALSESPVARHGKDLAWNIRKQMTRLSPVSICVL